MSVPARFGIPAAIWGARGCHVVTTALLVWYAAATDAGGFFWLGLAIVAGAFVYEHSIVKPHDLSRLNRAFFQVNGFIGIALFVCALLDLLVRGLTVSECGPPMAHSREPADGDTQRKPPPWIVGVSGASGTPYAAAVLRALLAAGESVDLVVSRASRLTLLDETGIAFRDAHWQDDLRRLAGRGADGKPGTFDGRTRGRAVLGAPAIWRRGRRRGRTRPRGC